MKDGGPLNGDGPRLVEFPLPRGQEPSPSVVRNLEKLLELAKEGRILGFAIATVNDEFGGSGSCYSIDPRVDPLAVLGRTQYLVSQLVSELAQQYERGGA